MSGTNPRDQIASLLDRVAVLEAERSQFEPHAFSVIAGLRDYFAGQALAGLLSRGDVSQSEKGPKVVDAAYAIADQMIAKRAVKPEGKP